MPVCFESFCHSFQLHAIRSSCTGVCAAPLAPPSHRTGTFSQTLRKRRGDLIFPSSEGHICALHKPYSCVLRYSALSSWQDEQARRPEELVCARSGAIRRVNTLVQGGYICANVVIVACVVASRGSIDASTSGSSLSFALHAIAEQAQLRQTKQPSGVCGFRFLSRALACVNSARRPQPAAQSCPHLHHLTHHLCACVTLLPPCANA